MMRKSCRRARRYVDPGAFLRAVNMQQQLDGIQLVELTLAVRAALEALRIGVGVEHHVHTLASCVNLSLVLAERGWGADFMPRIIGAQLAMVRTIERGKRTGRWGFDGLALQQIDFAVEVYEAQVAAVPRRIAVEAVREVSRRMDKGLVFEVAA